MNRIYYIDFGAASKRELNAARRQYMKNPMSLLEVNEKDAGRITARIVEFLKGYTAQSRTKGYVIGLSGGIDSAVSAALAVKAVGSENVYGMLLSSKYTAKSHEDDAFAVANKLGIKTNDPEHVKKHFDEAVELTMLMTGITKEHPNYKLLLGNNHARERMKILRGKAASLGYLVLGTTNLTEAWLGYATIAGDGYKGVDIEPIQRLPKTSERMYARFIEIPGGVITKAPTAGLWENQTDEGEIGMVYEDIDRVMAGFLLSISIGGILKANNKPTITKQTIEAIIARARANEFKAKPEPFALL
ncbi:MAG TPA: NAD(+) synthase [Nanoarchaeota archaeon]|nr:NAD(+) synthase [Nanoarchaeota archaeon]